jgi:hypothetical protein
VHVVDQLGSRDRLEKATEEDALLVSVNKVVAMSKEQGECARDDKQVEKELEKRRADGDGSQPPERGDPENADTGDLHVFTLTVGQKIDVDSELGHHHGSIVDTERCTAW